MGDRDARGDDGAAADEPLQTFLGCLKLHEVFRELVDLLAECGNSGNSTEPCVHVQVTDSTDWHTARGIPIRFRAYRSVSTGATVQSGLPGEREIVEPA